MTEPEKFKSDQMKFTVTKNEVAQHEPPPKISAEDFHKARERSSTLRCAASALKSAEYYSSDLDFVYQKVSSCHEELEKLLQELLVDIGKRNVSTKK